MKEIPKNAIIFAHDNPCFDANENESILRLSTDSSLTQALNALNEKVPGSSIAAIELTLTHKIDEICYEEFMQILQIFTSSEIFFFSIESSEEKSGSFLLWCGQGRRQIFVLQSEDEEKKIFSHVRRFLLASLKSGHDGELKIKN